MRRSPSSPSSACWPRSAPGPGALRDQHRAPRSLRGRLCFGSSTLDDASDGDRVGMPRGLHRSARVETGPGERVPRPARGYQRGLSQGGGVTSAPRRRRCSGNPCRPRAACALVARTIRKAGCRSDRSRSRRAPCTGMLRRLGAQDHGDADDLRAARAAQQVERSLPSARADTPTPTWPERDSELRPARGGAGRSAARCDSAGAGGPRSRGAAAGVRAIYGDRRRIRARARQRHGAYRGTA